MPSKALYTILALYSSKMNPRYETALSIPDGSIEDILGFFRNKRTFDSVNSVIDSEGSQDDFGSLPLLQIDSLSDTGRFARVEGDNIKCSDHATIVDCPPCDGSLGIAGRLGSYSLGDLQKA